MTGLLSTGFVPKTREQVLEDLRDAIANGATLGANINTEPESPMGQLVEIFGAALAELWSELGRVHQGQLLRSASTQNLERLAEILGVAPRRAATRTTVTLQGLGGYLTLPAGSRVRLTDSNALFEVLTDTAFGLPVLAQAVDTGPIQVLAGSTWTIVTPVAGWTGVTNAADGTTGQAPESDGQLRARLLQSTGAGRGSGVDALAAGVLRVDQVTECVVIENRSIFTDTDGRPGKSVEVLVRGGADQAVLDAIWLHKTQGAETVTTVSPANQITGTVQDRNGDAQTVQASRPDLVDVWVEIDYRAKPTAPSDIEASMTQALLDFEAGLTIGQDVEPVDLEQAVLCAFEVPVFLRFDLRVGLAANPPGALPIPTSKTQLPAFDSSRVTFGVV